MDFSSYKTWRNIIIAVIAIIFIVTKFSPTNEESNSYSTSISKEEQLLAQGKEFILRQVNSPSTTTFLSYNDKVEGLLREWGVTLEEKHDALMIEFETTNALGGRVRKNLCVFYVNGNPIDYADGDYINRANVHQYISIMKEKGW